MPVLRTELRNKLERTIVQAREVAEAGAKAALEALAVHHHEPYGHMSSEERKLRNHLRARARQLGDRQSRKGELETTHLVWECAYEHWHRMLFARFLAENDLLIEPEMGVAISLEECEELAKEEGKDFWTLASDFAQRMLPQIFRIDDPIFKIRFAQEHRIKLEKLLADLESPVFTASDSLGWVYQFWQAKRKKKINESENKIGADEVPSVTQLFTEPYMVNFLIHNTIGAWWAGKVLAKKPELSQYAKNEEELRQAVALPGANWIYLRFIQNDVDKGKWRPAAGTFESWPKTSAELKILDPCCGSGHFLVALLSYLVPIRVAEENISISKAIDSVLKENLHGLEIDERCTQIAAFSLALSAWTYPNEYGYRDLPELNIACSGIPVGSKVEEWVRFAGEDRRLADGMERIHRLFNKAPLLGSLIDPLLAAGDLFTAGFSELKPLIENALERPTSKKSDSDIQLGEVGITAKGITRATNLLSAKYHLVITNVPYLVRGKQNSMLKEFCESRYPEAKADLATSMLERCLEFAGNQGTVATVILQYWLFLATYTKLRKKLFKSKCWKFVAQLGEGGFETISGAVVNVALTIIEGSYPIPKNVISGINISEGARIDEKKKQLIEGNISIVKQNDQLNNPDCRFLLMDPSKHPKLGEYSIVSEGLHTGDYPRFGRKFWEIPKVTNGWVLQQAAASETIPYGGREHIIFWEEGKGILIKFVKERLGGQHTSMWIKGDAVWGRAGVAVSVMSDLRATLYTGKIFTHGAIVVVPKNPSHLHAIWSYLSSPEFNKNVRLLDKKICVARASVESVPFDLKHWEKKGGKIDTISKARCNDPSQWSFLEDIVFSANPLQIAVCNLLGFRWPKQNLKIPGEIENNTGVACIASLRGEDNAGDLLRKCLAHDYGKDWSPSKERKLIYNTSSKSNNFEEWFRNDFFEQHCKLFHHRPFIWHIWDGRKRDGFHALVNYHKLAEENAKGRQLLETLTYSYLGDWITRQKEGVRRGEGGAEDRLAAALELQKRLIAIIEGEPPFDIFVRWKPIEEQAIGWEPDIDDGVRLNIRPFMAQDIPGGRKGSGILRWKPNIKWNKDRGKEPFRPREQYPWFWENGEFTGDRVNDIHLTNEEKRQVREKMSAEG